MSFVSWNELSVARLKVAAPRGKVYRFANDIAGTGGSMGLKSHIKSRLSTGLTLPLGPVGIGIKAVRRPSGAVYKRAPNLELSYAKALERRFPVLAELGLPLDDKTAAGILELYLAYLPAIYEPAANAHLRSHLHRLKTRASHDALRIAVEHAIAISNLADGLPDRAVSLRTDDCHAKAWATDAAALETAYGAKLIGEDWSDASRGETLVFYFEAHPQLVMGKSILHFAPEQELQQWLQMADASHKPASYYSADGIRTDVDGIFDITDIALPDESFDLIICHRVLEHIPDDALAFSELFRLLRPGGMMNFSVPQAPHKSHTKEWVLPDESHDGHVRHYGRDLEDRMRASGFRVELEPWLLQQPYSVLRSRRAYPMRIYNVWR